MRRRLIAGNWKMHKNSETARGFATEFSKLYQVTPGIDVCIAAPFTELLALEEMFAGTDLLTAAQNMHFEDQGAFRCSEQFSESLKVRQKSCFFL